MSRDDVDLSAINTDDLKLNQTHESYNLFNNVDDESKPTTKKMPQIPKTSIMNNNTSLKSSTRTTSQNSSNNNGMSKSSDLSQLESRVMKNTSVVQKCLEIGEKVRKLAVDANSANVRSIEDLLKNLSIQKHELGELSLKLSKNEYDIAIMGLEKAGKTTFLNALLGMGLLPTRRRRCTYTTTELKSCLSPNEQKIYIEYLSTADFERNKNEIGEKIKLMGKKLPELGEVESAAAATANTSGADEAWDFSSNDDKSSTNLQVDKGSNWIEEYKEILRVEKDVKKYLDQKPLTKEFSDHKNVEIMKLVEETISDPKIARAVKRVVIYTHKLNAKNRVTFHDVPGYDSPTTMHKRQTKEKGKLADAIIFVKKFVEPDLKDSEIEMFEIFGQNDEFVPLKEKIIVAITFIDGANDKSDYEQTLGEMNSSFSARGISTDRLFPVCSAATRNVKEEEAANRTNAIERLRTLGIDDGFERLEDYVDNYVVNSRFKNLEKKLDILSDRINKTISGLNEISRRELNFKMLEDFFNDMTNKEAFEEQKKRAQNEWWALEWKKIYEEFQGN